MANCIAKFRPVLQRAERDGKLTFPELLKLTRTGVAAIQCGKTKAQKKSLFQQVRSQMGGALRRHPVKHPGDLIAVDGFYIETDRALRAPIKR